MFFQYYICKFPLFSTKYMIKYFNIMFSEITEDDDNGWNPWGEEFEKEGSYLHRHQPPKILWNREDIKSDNSIVNTSSIHIVDIWSIAAIGRFNIVDFEQGCKKKEKN